MIDPLLIEGAVHHLDYLADFAGARCESIYAETWNPAWGSFGGDSQALITLRMANGVRATYEGAKTNAVSLNGWGQEYIRAECEKATLILDHRQLECFDYDPTGQNTAHREGEGRLLPLIKRGTWTNAWLIEQFCDSLDSGEPMGTNVEDNLQSVAMVFGAIESSRTGKAVDVQAFLQRARERAWPG
jgi:predicted dehydrogenase